MIKLYQNKAWLTQKYLNENFSAEKIALLCGVSSPTIYNALKKFGIVKKK